MYVIFKRVYLLRYNVLLYIKCPPILLFSVLQGEYYVHAVFIYHQLLVLKNTIYDILLHNNIVIIRFNMSSMDLNLHKVYLLIAC